MQPLEIAERIKTVMGGMTQDEFAALCGLKQPTVSRLLNGEKTSLRGIIQNTHIIAQATGYRWEWLLFGTLPVYADKPGGSTKENDIQTIKTYLSECDPALVRHIRYLLEIHLEIENI